MTIPHHNADELVGATLTASRQAGCDCSPDIDVHEEFPGIYRAVVAHDQTCHLISTRNAHLN